MYVQFCSWKRENTSRCCQGQRQPQGSTQKSLLGSSTPLCKAFYIKQVQCVFSQWPTWERAGCQAPTASPPPPPLPPPYPSPPVQIWKSSTIKLLANCPDKKYFLTWTPSSEPGSESLPISLPGGENMKTFEKMPETFVSWLEKNNHRGVSDNQELVIVSVTFKDVLDVEKYLLQLLRWHRFRHLLDSRHNPRGNDWPKHWNSDRFWFVCVQTVWVSDGNWKK